LIRDLNLAERAFQGHYRTEESLRDYLSFRNGRESIKVAQPAIFSHADARAALAPKVCNTHAEQQKQTLAQVERKQEVSECWGLTI
jgi:hypothetical protein